MVIDAHHHLWNYHYEKHQWIDDTMTSIRQDFISQFPNVICKVSGMITEADHRDWTYEQLVPYLDIVFESFGVNRLMFGSDWPVCLLAGQYNQVLSVLERYISEFSQKEKDLILRENATNFYNL